MLNMIEQSVAPVETVTFEIHRQPVGPAEGHVAESDYVAAVGISPTDVGRAVPLGKENVPGKRGKIEFLEDSDGSE